MLKRKPAPAVISANGNAAPYNRFSVFSIATGAIQPFTLITTAMIVESMKGFLNNCLSRWLSPFFLCSPKRAKVKTLIIFTKIVKKAMSIITRAKASFPIMRGATARVIKKFALIEPCNTDVKAPLLMLKCLLRVLRQKRRTVVIANTDPSRAINTPENLIANRSVPVKSFITKAGINI